MLETLATQSTTGGFKPINGSKRPLTPTPSTAVSSPFKRLAVDTAPKLPVTPEHGTGCRVSSNKPQAFDGRVESAEQCPLPDVVRTSPTVSEATIEVPETPPSTLPLHPPHIAGSWRDEADSWMDDFVNLDTIADQGFIPSNGPLVCHHQCATQTPSESHAKPFPHLDVENLKQAVQDGETTMEDDTLDEYSIDGSDIEDMVMLLASADASPSKPSPSPLHQNIDQAPMSTGSFDPKFHSSCSEASHDEASRINFSEPDFLDEDIDWDTVAACAKHTTSSPKTKILAEAASMQEATSPPGPTPITRPPFPRKMRDRSVVVGLSSMTVIRTCFRIGELLNTHAKCTREKQDVVLELFARVGHSSRETTARVQHFKLLDLFTDRQPFLSGALRNWKLNSSLDHHTRCFLGPSGENKLCRCVCRLSNSKETTIGRTAIILSIREMDWDEIYWALRVVARDAPSDSASSLLLLE
ncbi:hypothetical protein LX32DRAFT_733931 [Colletotrichum zoysiae]|uniref:Uncharacterized protein n=1 Tax=Colletotrichum zoysiae TaxID=1216348 RepID=A0AAD9H1Z4_9PEZI|nr:hypothetical protein LX32DRAFT_733931 [Colletotrichum zoysiae]